MGFQRFIGLGNVVRDPAFRKANEHDIASFSIAINTGKDSRAEFIDLEWWDPNGAIGYISAGTQVMVEGTGEKQSGEKDGQKRSRTVVKVRSLQLVGSKPTSAPPVEEFASDFA